MGHVVRSIIFLAAALTTLVLRQQFVIEDASAVPLTVVFTVGFVISVLWAVRSTAASQQLTRPNSRA